MGIGSGFPLATNSILPGGGGIGMGSGLPLRTAAVSASKELLENCLHKLLTGSSIKSAKTMPAKRTEIF